MKNEKNRRFRFIIEIACIAIAMCMLLGAVPAVAAEETEAPAGEEKPAEITIVVAAKKIATGTYITNDFLTMVTVPNLNIPENVITDMDEAMTKYSKFDIAEGEYVSSDALTDKKVNKVNNDSLVQDITESTDDYLVVTDYILPNTGKDVSALLQSMIDRNPKRTIYFPDGVYTIASPLFTDSTAHTSVTLKLSDGAVLQASSKWKGANGTNYMICSGGGTTANDIDTIGSYFGVMGGTLDGNGKADGIEIVSGRETLFRDICIKNVRNGVYIQRGLNGGSSDDDFEDISIYGTGASGTTGITVIGHDNTFTNIRIYGMETGIDSRGGTSLYKNISVYGTAPATGGIYDTTVGIKASSWAWVSQCYVENCATAYLFTDSRIILFDSIAKWTSEEFATQTAFSLREVHMPMGGVRVEFCGEDATCLFIKSDNFGSRRVIEGCSFDTALEDSDEAYAENLRTPIIPIK